MNNIDIYYESIKQVFKQIQDWKPPKQPIREGIIDGILIFSVLLFITTLIPVIPALVIVFGDQSEFSIYTIVLKDASFIDFLKIWGGFTAASLILMLFLIWINNKVDSIEKEPSKPPQSLSPEQLTFISVYESYKELKIFFVSHIDQHIDNSLHALSRVLPYPKWLWSDIDPGDKDLIWRNIEGNIVGMYPEKHRDLLGKAPNLIRQVRVATSFLNTFDKYAWFQLDMHTKSTLQALISFSEKIPSRLKDKQDLPRVLDVLENFSRFTYAYLPEHKTYMESKILNDLQVEGANCLEIFTQEVNELTSYTPAETEKSGKHEIGPTIIVKLQRKFSENVFVRFFIWFLLILALTSGAVSLINKQSPLSPDTMVTIIIGTSIASAAALAGFLPTKSN